MGACATRPGDLKVKGEAPLVVEDAVGEKKADGVSPAVETDPADVSRRRSLSDLLKEDADGDGEAPDAEKIEPAIPTDETGAAEEQLIVQPSIATQQDTAEKRKPEGAHERGVGGGDAAQVVEEEEKRVDPDSVQVAAAAANAEESKVADDSV